MIAGNNYKTTKGISKKWRWLIVVLYTLSIYAFLPFGPKLWTYVLNYNGKLAGCLVITIISLFVIYFLFRLVLQKKVKDVYVYLTFFLILLACIALFKYICVYSSERFHLFMYGILSGVVFYAFEFDIKTNRIYIYTSLLVCALGVIDEVIQFLLPMRFFDIRDIFLNWISGGLGILFIAFVLKPRLFAETT